MNSVEWVAWPALALMLAGAITTWPSSNEDAAARRIALVVLGLWVQALTSLGVGALAWIAVVGRWRDGWFFVAWTTGSLVAFVAVARGHRRDLRFGLPRLLRLPLGIVMMLSALGVLRSRTVPLFLGVSGARNETLVAWIVEVAGPERAVAFTKRIDDSEVSNPFKRYLQGAVQQELAFRGASAGRAVAQALTPDRWARMDWAASSMLLGLAVGPNASPETRLALETLASTAGDSSALKTILSSLGAPARKERVGALAGAPTMPCANTAPARLLCATLDPPPVWAVDLLRLQVGSMKDGQSWYLSSDPTGALAAQPDAGYLRGLAVVDLPVLPQMAFLPAARAYAEKLRIFSMTIGVDVAAPGWPEWQRESLAASLRAQEWKTQRPAMLSLEFVDHATGEPLRRIDIMSVVDRPTPSQ